LASFKETFLRNFLGTNL
ncbi:hypothetical protein CP8484711_0334B, partial [Chlamydia psittaci 84-8471/1]